VLSNGSLIDEAMADALAARHPFAVELSFAGATARLPVRRYPARVTTVVTAPAGGDIATRWVALLCRSKVTASPACCASRIAQDRTAATRASTEYRMMISPGRK